jgi:multicomponent Na+:H+ antiporter subunit G
MSEVLLQAALVGGCALILLSAFGVWRMPDVICRGHALSAASTLGLGLLLAALWFELGGIETLVKVVLIMVFQFLTIPVAGHLLANLAWRNGQPLHGIRPAAERDSGLVEKEKADGHQHGQEKRD